MKSSGRNQVVSSVSILNVQYIPLVMFLINFKNNIYWCAYVSVLAEDGRLVCGGGDFSSRRLYKSRLRYAFLLNGLSIYLNQNSIITWTNDNRFTHLFIYLFIFFDFMYLFNLLVCVPDMHCVTWTHIYVLPPFNQ